MMIKRDDNDAMAQQCDDDGAMTRWSNSVMMQWYDIHNKMVRWYDIHNKMVR